MIEIPNNSETIFSLLVKGNALRYFSFFLEQSECSGRRQEFSVSIYIAMYQGGTRPGAPMYN